tara:strand:+ start:803 stop:1030 length:228 start_codon:yes stop_codon:yes gene_type:complete
MDNLNIAQNILNNHKGPKTYTDPKYGELVCKIVPFPQFHYCNIKGCKNDQLYVSYRNDKLDFDMCFDCQRKSNDL